MCVCLCVCDCSISQTPSFLTESPHIIITSLPLLFVFPDLFFRSLSYIIPILFFPLIISSHISFSCGSFSHHSQFLLSLFFLFFNFFLFASCCPFFLSVAFLLSVSIDLVSFSFLSSTRLSFSYFFLFLFHISNVFLNFNYFSLAELSLVEIFR